MSSHDSNSLGVEPEGLSFPAIFGSMFVSIIVVVALVIAGAAYAGMKFHDAKVSATEVSGYPALRETKMMGASKMTSYGKTDNGRYIIPIERAMEMEAREAGN
ncbi:hypothetical protein HQ496_10280 [bacterium]|nr:hypothetical protein [bacterium]